ncbi:hypothetical protein CPE1_0958 [Chlamydia pecorum PV3056/3]|uniref:PAS domain-containing protein n=1 Tax=Chlamydia pecorum TaxID=85991 RepID=A0AA40PRP4_9CHLA|nr:hypothetical protein [Chlamydia pecorum]AGW38425.1 hypothetical protein CPE1_0958 [Chlamydia pecorum PV3056/3]KTF29056.1 hypothetical protein cpL1_0267 [Chlamydia pecorum]
MLLVKKWFRTNLRGRTYFFPLAILLSPFIFYPFLSDFQKNYSGFVFATISSLGWFFAVRYRENQLKTAAEHLLQEKIRKITENNEGLRQIRASLQEHQQEAKQLKLQNQNLLNQLFHAQEIFSKTKGEKHHLEACVSRLKEETQRQQMQLQSLMQEYKEKEEESIKLSRELAEMTAYQQALNDEYQATFIEQHSILNKRQAYIAKLESKVQDLMYEIRNLLQLESDTSDAHVPGTPCIAKDVPSQISYELKKIVFKAENIEAASSLTASRYMNNEVGIRNYSLECRELFDGLREESLGMVFIYAPQSRRAVFANSLFKTWTGYSVEDFFKNDGIVVSDIKQWESDLQSRVTQERRGKLIIKTKTQGSLPFYYCLTSLSKGPLYRHVLGILYPARKETF